MTVYVRIFFLSVILTAPAQAYIDPGSGMLLLQGLFAAVGGILAFVKKPREVIAKLFRRSPK